MLIVALVCAVIGLAALITAVVTSNEIIAWVCIGASGLGILILIVDAIRERSRMIPAAVVAEPSTAEITEVIEPVERIEVIEVIEPAETIEIVEPAQGLGVADDETRYDTEVFATEAAVIAAEDHPDELVYDEPDYDLPSDDEAEFPEPAEEAAIHVVTEDLVAEDLVTGESVADGSATDLIVVEDAIEQYTETDATESYATESYATESYATDTAENEPVADAESAATEIRYVASAEGSADTVYTYSEDTEYIEAQDPQATDEPRDQ